MDCNGISALVTGSARRVGRSIALELARHGADVVIHCNRSVDEAEQVAGEIAAMGRRAEVVAADQRDWEAVRSTCDQAWKLMEGIDVLVNNAAIFERTPVAQTSEEGWDRLLDANLKGPFAWARFLGPRMKERGRGKIVNMADVGAERVWPGFIPYCISKAGIIAMTEGLAKALAPAVQVNAIGPGVILWPEDADDEHKERVLQEVPLRREGSPEDIARAVRFFVENDYLTGVFLPVDGGRILS
jgi:NAD(P)-dependent dehydrogenase (short-subunit alcohol dehydrogenase family)